jgi:hypothetical protein
MGLIKSAASFSTALTINTAKNVGSNLANAANEAYTNYKVNSSIDDAKEEFAKTGDPSSITNDVDYIKQKGGYTNEELANMLSTPSSKVTAQDISASLNTGDSGYLNSDDLEMDKDSVLGLPFRYSYIADPNRRIYNRTFMMDGGVISFIPGKPAYRQNDSKLKKLFNGSVTSTSDLNLGMSDSDDGILSWLKINQKNQELSGNKDLRYYRHEACLDEFIKVLNINCLTVASKMGINTNNARFENMIQTQFNSASIKFYTGKTASVSEGVSNEFGASSMSGKFKDISDNAKEALFLTGGELGSDTLGSSGGIMGKIQSALNSFTQSIENTKAKIDGQDLTKYAGDLWNGKTLANKGVNMFYPDIWKDSSTTRDYSLEFNFISPYGTPDAIYEYVYFPFLVLFSLASARQVGVNGYISPFILKVDMPGTFTSDCAVITSLSWKKGGNENLYSKDGLPLAITVNISIKDLYQMFMQANSWSDLRCNTGMHAFLDNMAGLAIDRLTPFSDIEASIKARLGYVEGTFDRVINKSNSWLYRISRPSS